VFWLPGVHKVDVRSRVIGHPESMDREPFVIELPIGTGNPLPVARNAGFHGQAGASGCGCETTSSASGGLMALIIGLIVLPTRRVRRRIGRAAKRLAREALRLGPVVLIAAIASLPGWIGIILAGSIGLPIEPEAVFVVEFFLAQFFIYWFLGKIISIGWRKWRRGRDRDFAN
jgi:MYXO-CTERM domain-containing protein